ncbi:MAG: hypothetical protein ABIL49_03150 [candidate division WOR-3 bacterium]|jgi:hypothetical protein
MRLTEGEEKIAEYHFKKGGKILILTNKRLVVIYKNSEESYPLNKIISVKISQYRFWIWSVIGLAMIILGFFSLPSDFSIIGLILIISGILLVFFGLQKKLLVVITHQGGQKKFEGGSKDKELIDFIDAVNSKLS